MIKYLLSCDIEKDWISEIVLRVENEESRASNKTIDDIPDLPAYDQLRVNFTKITNYYKEIYDKLDKIISSGEKYSVPLSRLYAKARDFLDPECKYVEDDKMFSNILMEFIVSKTEPFHVGCKISGRY